jgi:hypothetical protein
VLSFGGLNNLAGRIAEGEVRGNVEAILTQSGGGFFKVFAVGSHLFGFGEFQVIKVAGRPSIGDVNEEELRLRKLCQSLDMRKKAGIRPAILECNQNFVIHGDRSSQGL